MSSTDSRSQKNPQSSDQSTTNPNHMSSSPASNPNSSLNSSPNPNPNLVVVILLSALLLAAAGLAGYLIFQTNHLQQQIGQLQSGSSQNGTQSESETESENADLSRSQSENESGEAGDSDQDSDRADVDDDGEAGDSESGDDAAEPSPYADWLTYQNDDFDFSLKYPTNFELQPQSEMTRTKPFYSLEEPIPLGLNLIQDVYTALAQTPMIQIRFIRTDLTVSQVLDQLKAQIADQVEAMEDPGHMYHGAVEPNISMEREVTVSTLSGATLTATKIERFQGPGAPNAYLLEYWIENGSYIVVLSANFNSPTPEDDQGGVEKQVLPEILKTLNLDY